LDFVELKKCYDPRGDFLLVGFFQANRSLMLKSSVVGVLVLDGPDLESSSSQLLLVVNIEVVEKLNLTVEVCRDRRFYCC
jgi:hypothetical protein